MNDIEIVSVNALGDGSIMLLSVDIKNGENNEKRKLALFTNDYLELGLRKGSKITEEQFDMLEEKTKVCLAVRKASELLSYSSPSKRELSEKLKRRGFEKEIADKATKIISNSGVINEERDVKRFAEICLSKLYGKKRIILELTKKGYERKDIENAIEEIDEHIFIENCFKLLQKKIGSIKIKTLDQNSKDKLVAFLTRYGYSFAEIKEAINRI